MRIPSEPSEVGAVRAEIMRRAEEAGLPREAAEQLTLAAHEAIMNAIEHGNRRNPKLMVTVEFEDREDFFVVRILDEGPGPSATPAPFRPIADRGRGIPLMRGLVDVVQLSRNRGEAILAKRKPPREENA